MNKQSLNIYETLIEKCKQNDKKAQFQLYEMFYKPMFNTSLRIVGNRAEAEDAMQEAFLAAFRKIDTYKGEVSFGAWLKRIVINKSLDALKKHRMVLENIDETPQSRLEDYNAENESSDFEYKVDDIKTAIMQLAEGYRVVLSLFLLEGYDHEEISQILNISQSSSRSQLSRAKQKLFELLKLKSGRFFKNPADL